MPLFKRDAQKESGEQHSLASMRVLNQEGIFDRLEEEIFRAERYGRALMVLCVLPQRLPGEDPQPKETTLAADALSGRLRFSDRVGMLDDGTLVVLLPETSGDAARVVAHKIVADLAIRGSGLGHAKWLVGTSTFPEDGTDPSSMVVAAFQRAKI